MVLDGSLHKNIQLMLKFLKAPLLVWHFSQYVNDLPDDVICNSAIFTDDTTLYSKCEQTFDLGQQLWLVKLNLIYETLWTGVGGGLLISMLK